MQFPALPASWKLVAFTSNLIGGLILAQLAGLYLNDHDHHIFHEIILFATLWTLSYIMINVGYEFTVDKDALSLYVWDYLIAMTAAGFPWIFAAVYFLMVLDNMSASEAFVVARFAAPTSAGILFSMLDAAGLRNTWLFQKARVLAIFDDLDTILLMIPLKVMLVGFKWELLVSVGIMVALLVVAWFKLHAVQIPHSWQWTLFYGAIIAVVCKLIHHVTHHYIDMEPVHIEVLLPAFVMGCIIDTPGARHELELQRQASREQLARQASKVSVGTVNTNISVVVVQPAPAAIQAAPAVNEVATQKKQQKEMATPGKQQKTVATQTVLSVKTNKAKPAPQQPETPEKSGALQPETPEKSDALQPVVPGQIDPLDDLLREADEMLKEVDQADTHNFEQVIKLQTPIASPRTPRKIWSAADVASSASSATTVSRYGAKHEHHEDPTEEYVNTTISLVFMVLVGLSMPPFVGQDDGEEGLDGLELVMHVAAMTVLMILGKMFPVVCYKDEACLKERLALCMGMCPRGEVGASIIVISLELGVSGPAVTIAMLSLVINLVLSGGFVGSVKMLLAPPK